MKTIITSVLGFFILFIACQNSTIHEHRPDNNTHDHLERVSNKTEKAVVAGGCFWCIEQPFEGIDGIISAVSGYAGGEIDNPSYSQVAGGETRHRESVQITFDPHIISFSEILSIYWKQFNPTDAGGSFADRGHQYTSAIFYITNEQKKAAQKSKKALTESGIFEDSIVTPIIAYTNFYRAEEYHQDYYKKKPDDYWSYKRASGRVQFIKNTWGKIQAEDYPVPSRDEIKKSLSGLQYRVTQNNGTEPAFDNKYWNHKKSGIYVDIVSGEPLFSSKDKFISGTGWPSFTKPIDPRYLNKTIDSSGITNRVEVRSRFADSHLGHVFYDGPDPTKLRYCINSAAMNFIPKDEMKEKGYGKYMWLVK
jgi:peptide methionine sulfoxide reductase msrA/msrB